MHSVTLVAIVVVLILLSAVCSGLNIGLMSLKLGDLRRKAKLGSLQAAMVLPFRKNSHLSLAAILLTNVAVISTTSLVLGNHFNGFLAGAASTILIVIFGEVVPQALFVKHALRFCAWFAPLLRLMIICTYPVSMPLALLLDRLLGPEVPHLQTRHELGLVFGEHAKSEESELDESELDIMLGALSLSEKHVQDIMTPIRKVYWLTPDATLDGLQLEDIKAHGWSRIPIINREHTHVSGVLMMKDLVDINFDERSYAISELPLHPTRMVGSRTALDTLFRRFISARSHLMPVEKDDKIVGIVTIEDLLEEIIGHEIEDESDQARHRRSAAR